MQRFTGSRGRHHTLLFVLWLQEQTWTLGDVSRTWWWRGRQGDWDFLQPPQLKLEPLSTISSWRRRGLSPTTNCSGDLSHLLICLVFCPPFVLFSQCPHGCSSSHLHWTSRYQNHNCFRCCCLVLRQRLRDGWPDVLDNLYILLILKEDEEDVEIALHLLLEQMTFIWRL